MTWVLIALIVVGGLCFITHQAFQYARTLDLPPQAQEPPRELGASPPVMVPKRPYPTLEDAQDEVYAQRIRPKEVPPKFVEAFSEPGRELIAQSGDVTFYRCGPQYIDAIYKGKWLRCPGEFSAKWSHNWALFPSGNEASYADSSKVANAWNAMQNRKAWGTSPS